MSKYTPIKLTQLSANESAAVDAINQNLDSIKEHIDDSLSRSAKSPSQMLADLDMNGQKLLNLGAPTKDTDVVRLKDVIENKEEIKTLVNTASVAVDKAMEAAETAESAAEDMADQIQKARDWATKTDGPVEDGEYSSKWYAENIGADVHTVADIAEDVTAVAGNATNINTVAGNESNINTVAGISSDVSTVAGNTTDVSAVATNMSDVNDCADNMAAIQDAPNQAASAAASATAAQEAALSITGYDLFDHKWSDHLLNDQNWLRADTNSWQDGTVYTEAYQHLVDDVNGVITNWYSWRYSTTIPAQISRIYTRSSTPSVGDTVFDYQQGETTKTITSVNEDSITVSDGNVYSRESSQDITTGSQSETVGSYTITYYQAQDGHKICLPDQETTVQNIYNESGVAWYYILDTANQRFKLPRTKHGFVGLRDTVGKYVPESLPNLKTTEGTFINGVISSSSALPSGLIYANGADQGQAINVATNASYTRTWNYGFDASRASSTYQDNAPVQQRATQMYLYFYVGNFTQTATEQTAGLNSELFNGKVDLDAANLSIAGKSLISGLGMPSNRYEDLTLGASGSTYTAPANGYFSVSKNANGANQFLGMYNATNKIACFWNNPANGNLCEQFIPVKEGDVIQVNYDLGGDTQRFVFIYAEGEENV